MRGNRAESPGRRLKLRGVASHNLAIRGVRFATEEWRDALYRRVARRRLGSGLHTRWTKRKVFRAWWGPQQRTAEDMQASPPFAPCASDAEPALQFGRPQSIIPDVEGRPRTARTGTSGEKGHRRAVLHERWIDHYGEFVAEQLTPERRYSVLRVGLAEFAYTTYDAYVRALGQAWSAGLIPQPLGAITGDRLLDVAPNLRGVDADLTNLRASDVVRPSRFS
jgi:hypothetical protein